jgi:hypothetical protein
LKAIQPILNSGSASKMRAQNIENNPMQGRRGPPASGKTIDTSGKSGAYFQYSEIRMRRRPALRGERKWRPKILTHH